MSLIILNTNVINITSIVIKLPICFETIEAKWGNRTKQKLSEMGLLIGFNSKAWLSIVWQTVTKSQKD